jgi:hypothetical protein
MVTIAAPAPGSTPAEAMIKILPNPLGGSGHSGQLPATSPPHR